MLALCPLVAVLAFLCSEVRAQTDTAVPAPLLNDTAVPAPASTLQPTTIELTGELTSNGTIEPAPSPVTRSMEPTYLKPDCYDDLTILANDMLEKEAFASATYILCPHTTFVIGTDWRDEICCADGQSPIVPRSNSRIYCGEDGKAENNCVLTGGQFQLWHSFFTYFEEADDVEIKGITFSDASYASIVLQSEGNVVLRNCVFQVRLVTLLLEKLTSPLPIFLTLFSNR
jgi:hypothetical protein